MLAQDKSRVPSRALRAVGSPACACRAHAMLDRLHGGIAYMRHGSVPLVRGNADLGSDYVIIADLQSLSHGQTGTMVDRHDARF